MISKPLQNILRENQLDGIILSDSKNIAYITNLHSFSSEEREAFLLILKNKKIIITDGRYTEAVLKKVKDFTVLERSAAKGIGEIIKDICGNYKIKKLGFEDNNLTFAEYKFIKKVLRENTKLVPAGKYLRNLRIVKDEKEISLIKKACKIGDEAFEHILPKIKIGVSEKEIAETLESFIKRKGASLSFYPIVAFGKNSSMPHHQTSNKLLTKSDKFILLDFGVKIENYCSDMTRTVFMGKQKSKIREMYQTVYNSQEKAVDSLNSSIRLNKSIFTAKVDKVARDLIINKGFHTIPHSLGHGIGLEVHEPPFLSPKSKDELLPNMVFSIEPGIYIPGLGGVRIEDLVVLTPKGIKFLTRSKKELIEL